MWTRIMKLPYTEVNFYPEVKSKPVWFHFGSHVKVLLENTKSNQTAKDWGWDLGQNLGNF